MTQISHVILFQMHNFNFSIPSPSCFTISTLVYVDEPFPNGRSSKQLFFPSSRALFTSICVLQNDFVDNSDMSSAKFIVSAGRVHEWSIIKLSRKHKSGSSPRTPWLRNLSINMSHTVSKSLQNKLLSFIDIHTKRFALEASKVSEGNELFCCRAGILPRYINHFGNRSYADQPACKV